MYEQYIDLIKERLRPERYIHSMNVARCAQQLALQYGADPDQAYLAGILHDVCKNDSDEKMLQMFSEFGIILDNIQQREKKLWHAICGAAYVQRVLHIEDRAVIDAIRYHTTARERMTLLDKILYIADFVSEERDFEGVEQLRESLRLGLDHCYVDALVFSIQELTQQKKPVHPDTCLAYNQAVLTAGKD